MNELGCDELGVLKLRRGGSREKANLCKQKVTFGGVRQLLFLGHNITNRCLANCLRRPCVSPSPD